MALVARTGSDPTGYAAAMTSQVQALDKNQPVAYVKTMESYLTESLAQRRFNMLLLGVFAALALLLASIGIYGVIAYMVTQRRHELGIRVALGAGAMDILKLVLRHAMQMTFIGIAIGLACAFMLTRFMGSLLYRIGATDPLTFIGLAALLTLVALAATLIPARRAMKVDPMTALRYE
jgi:ABC-type antimicrobial peptide transport system permease subunit